jgi:archaeosine synthase beta-subunit
MFKVPYPQTASARDRWILDRRGPKNRLNAREPYAFLFEQEPGPGGDPLPTATIFLTNRECPFRCLMCDLWRNTLDHRVEPGAIGSQIRFALDRLPSVRQIKLYNAGSFFDPQATPPEDDEEIAQLVSGYDRVIVECHPAFLKSKFGDRALRFRSLISGRLEVAIGLETVHPDALESLNKRMTLEEFRRAAKFLRENEIDLRVFVLLRPPGLTESEGVFWARESLDEAARCGAGVCSIIPTRGGNGALEALGDAYAPPKLASLEAVVEYGLSLEGPRVFSDLWEIEGFQDCDCSAARIRRLDEMNRTQRAAPPVVCQTLHCRE